MTRGQVYLIELLSLDVFLLKYVCHCFLQLHFNQERIILFILNG
jgi:hypothetical protein